MTVSFNRTKVIATTGPASSTYEELLSLVQASADVFRLNFSHGSYEDHKNIISNIKKINKEYHEDIGILADLQGPKLRIGDLENGSIDFKVGETVTFTTKECIGTKKCIYMSYQKFPQDVAVGDIVMLDDGKVELEVTSTNKKDEVKAKALYDCTLFPKKGVNLPDTKISIPSMTEKDHEDLTFALENYADWVALSFVRKASDILELKKIIKEKGAKARVIAKIEKPEACKNIDEIIEVSDAIMIARGDLGVEVPMEQMPLIQKEITRKCNIAAKPVIIATQIMDSMIERSKPTRAEITDVANAVIDGADALMLSGETSVGKHPLKVVQTMNKIIAHIESEEDIYNKYHIAEESSPTFLSDAICYSACKIADEVDAKAIIGMSRSGYTGFMVSSFRPKAQIFIFTDNPNLRFTMSLTWGVRTFFYDKMVSTDDTIKDLKDFILEKGLIEKGDNVINVASMPIGEEGRANMLKVSKA